MQINPTRPSHTTIYSSLKHANISTERPGGTVAHSTGIGISSAFVSDFRAKHKSEWFLGVCFESTYNTVFCQCYLNIIYIYYVYVYIYIHTHTHTFMCSLRMILESLACMLLR
jgi:hypothetical protein